MRSTDKLIHQHRRDDNSGDVNKRKYNKDEDERELWAKRKVDQANRHFCIA